MGLTRQVTVTRLPERGSRAGGRLLQQSVESGDLYLLCSDGLSDKIAKDELPSFLDGDELQTMVSRLVDEAKSRGGEDNISVVLVRVK